MKNKTKFLACYLENMGYEILSISSVSEILNLAINDGVTELLVTKIQFETIKRWMIYGFQWNWDGKTFMGMKIEVRE